MDVQHRKLVGSTNVLRLRNTIPHLTNQRVVKEDLRKHDVISYKGTHMKFIAIQKTRATARFARVFAFTNVPYT